MYDVASLIATAIILPLLGFIAVVLRFYVRLYLKPTYIGIDDWLIAVAVVLVYGQAANQIVGSSVSVWKIVVLHLIFQPPLSESWDVMVSPPRNGESCTRARYMTKQRYC